ncbi:30S ribosomal protein S24e [Ferroplasma acidiphilum]|uniref:Small ribosomal subunit protein eS24 n=2 Tax=Ferroplasma TaxID=74968 RepID=S0AR72_FERAC|nr:MULTISPECIES: 30S ribosomal protein S24 [Ferroplasma]AGO61456.1 30S ribosomal protein S24e [Ferroplasma acidarmanus Fer1]MCL4349568.1 30S ribosomal protein S24e [Candidatus Thermoplasmatota archaeon]WMT53286.1 MAG: 30S ribosomal protein S24e [Ferroplasma acidiphilum]
MSNEKMIKNFSVDSERDNKLLFRKEIKYTIDFRSGKTVSRNEIKKLLMDYYKAKEEVIIVDHNIQETGKDSLKGYVKIYDTKEHAMLYEPDYELLRNGLKEKESK